jgi:hypothetical protein
MKFDFLSKRPVILLRTELNALVLMGVFPQAAGFMNHKGMLPLHMACSQKDSSHVTVFKLLEIHHIMNLPIDLRDQEGTSMFITLIYNT